MSWAPSGEQIAGVVRSVGLIAGTLLVAKGWVSEAQLQEVLGYVVNLVMVLWSLKSNSPSSIITKAAETDNVKEVVMKHSKDADAIDSTKVVSEYGK